MRLLQLNKASEISALVFHWIFVFLNQFIRIVKRRVIHLFSPANLPVFHLVIERIFQSNKWWHFHIRKVFIRCYLCRSLFFNGQPAGFAIANLYGMTGDFLAEGDQKMFNIISNILNSQLVAVRQIFTYETRDPDIFQIRLTMT